ncbi:MAG TPA: hypothetical protein VJ741_04275 [Solirubrobacteraceae bacterium]|nr:hypothetical protein [Solirubrobacteraceae bacterium]
MADKEPGKLADDLQDEADELEQRSEKLKEETKNVAQEWERKRSDPNVPGAPPRDEDEQDEPPTGAPSGKGDEDED